jgi:hypothetical protein
MTLQMQSSALKKERVPFNAEMLRWARQWRGRSIEEVASKLKQPAKKIRDWEDKDSGIAPTVLQARSLAAFYERPFLEFFRAKPPPVQEYCGNPYYCKTHAILPIAAHWPHDAANRPRTQRASEFCYWVPDNTVRI